MTTLPIDDGPSLEDAPARPDWRESLTLATDLALLGIVLAVACVPVVTAGGALATASVAADHACRYRHLPSTMELWRVFRRALLPGLGASVVACAVAAMLLLDLRAIAAGAVPGGGAVLAATAAVGLAAVALAGLVLVRVGTTSGRGWVAAVRASAALLWSRPWVVLAVVPVAMVPVLLASVIPVTAPLLAGMGLFALHVVVRRIDASARKSS
jgi:hypothetical protein